MNRIKFLGTAGARFVVMKHLRASGGLWITLDETNLLIDPGPGSLVRCLTSKPKLNPLDLNAIILTHRHLDHANDINIMIEAMTNGGFKKRGTVFAPQDALSQDPVILRYIREYVASIEILHEQGEYHIGNLFFSTPKKHIHGVETYGLNLHGKNHTISLITDTKYFNGLERHYHNDIVIINVVRLEPKEGVNHLCLQDVETILSHLKPNLCILTHFGMTVLKAKPWKLAKTLTEKYKVTVLAAHDGMNIDLDSITKKK